MIDPPLYECVHIRAVSYINMSMIASCRQSLILTKNPQSQFPYQSVSRLVGWFFGLSTLFGLFNSELSHFEISFKQFRLVLVQFCLHAFKCQNSFISNNSFWHKFTLFCFHAVKWKNSSFRTIQFSVNTV